MATQRNKDVFLGGLMNLFKEQWQADILLKAGDSDDGAAISAHKLILVFSSSSSYLFFLFGNFFFLSELLLLENVIYC